MTDLPAHPILEGDAASAWMGLTVETAEKDRAVVRMTVRDEMVNGFGITHGGMIFAFADSCFALTCNDPDADGSTITVASGVDVNFLAPTTAGQSLIAEGRLVSRAGRSGVYDITVTTEDGAVVAVFRGRSRTIPNPAAR
ncbi:Phenylacetic acid degradation protein PaaD, thioesterase [Micrococcus lylae]|uniref:Phenylacetic acid degradation protein PaaD, thioesterase n=1 Tax=Micrococcus lylae TaxID=1273 RepID=A0A1R4IRE4_9MICC|nr:hydroxyphenylacetyl-CoA thioesterase PaaI [Micrococcus lylae]SJN22145.1 Phenylacetic acid degradation protein PaaD, thioesterase [Micrococcus lylae]